MKREAETSGEILNTPFIENAFYERLLEMERKGNLHITDLSTPTRLALGYYSAAKRQAEGMREER